MEWSAATVTVSNLARSLPITLPLCAGHLMMRTVAIASSLLVASLLLLGQARSLTGKG
jgi:hypothetical protein